MKFPKVIIIILFPVLFLTRDEYKKTFYEWWENIFRSRSARKREPES